MLKYLKILSYKEGFDLPNILRVGISHSLQRIRRLSIITMKFTTLVALAVFTAAYASPVPVPDVAYLEVRSSRSLLNYI